jgi:molybdopterin/thiamine biosynthesis adenylyltransferase
MSAASARHNQRWATTNAQMGLWYRVDPDLHILGIHAARRDAVTRLDAFRSYVKGGNWSVPARGAGTIAITVAGDAMPRDGNNDERPVALPFAAWVLSPDRNAAEMVPIMFVLEIGNPLALLSGPWPLTDLEDKAVAIIGIGSIGSAAAEALAGYGVRRLFLIDDERLSEHNFARHRVPESHLGRYKATAMADVLIQRDPQMRPEALVLNVIYDADQIRPVINEADVVLVATDGVDSRRAANHLTRRASKPVVLACVLEDGAYGEILRIRPPRTGCLLCARQKLLDDGGLDPEPSLDRGYGTGTRHLPMTAVGSDLALVGQFAAKAAVSTLLEELGFSDQRLPGGQAIIGLRPKPNMEAPFDIERALEVRWHDLPPPRVDCATCGAPV